MAAVQDVAQDDVVSEAAAVAVSSLMSLGCYLGAYPLQRRSAVRADLRYGGAPRAVIGNNDFKCTLFSATVLRVQRIAKHHRRR